MLAELDHVLTQTYFSEATVTEFLSDLVVNEKLTSGQPAEFWSNAGVLNIQHGSSQF